MASVTISQPSNDSRVTSPVQFSATSKTATCAKGVASMGVYVDNKLIYVVLGDKLSVKLPFKAGKYETVVEEWNRCGGASYTKRIITVTEAGTLTPATMSTPAPGTVLAGSGVSFTWTAGSGVAKYELRLGTTGAGSHNLYDSGTTTATTEAVTGLPTAGATVTATLYSLIGNTWDSNVYTYTEAGTLTPATMSTPAPGTVLAGSSVTFTWTAGNGVAKYELRLGTTGAGSSNLYNSGTITATTEAVTGLPAAGATVTATLYSLINGTWRSNDYTYTEGSPASYSVDLSWDAPRGSAEPVAGYNVYRSPSGGSTYQRLNSSVDTQTTYVDSTVQSGRSYDYVVESVDDSGVESAPTSPIAVSIP
jgi:hypothetical protein